MQRVRQVAHLEVRYKRERDSSPPGSYAEWCRRAVAALEAVGARVAGRGCSEGMGAAEADELLRRLGVEPYDVRSDRGEEQCSGKRGGRP